MSARNYLPSNMSDRPGYTSGRGPDINDLDSKKLTFIYDEIIKNENEEAGNAFVEMVQNLRVLSCTDFLLSLYSLERNKWVYNEKIFNNTTNGIYAENEGEGAGTILSIFGRDPSDTTDDTLKIASNFLSKFDKHHITDPYFFNSKINSDNYYNDYYND